MELGWRLEVPGRWEQGWLQLTILCSSILQEECRPSCPTFSLLSFDTFEPFPSSFGIKNGPLVYFDSLQSTSDFYYSAMSAGLTVIFSWSLILLLLEDVYKNIRDPYHRLLFSIYCILLKDVF